MRNRDKKPIIRFSVFSDSWKQCIFSEIADIKTGPFGSALHAEDYVDEGTPIITTEHFKGGSLPQTKENLPQVSDEDYKRLSSYILNVGDIVFSRVGSVDINAVTMPAQSGWLFSGRVLRAHPDNSVDSIFLHTLLETETVKKSIRDRAVGQTMPSINTEILGVTPLMFPYSIEEQTKLGELFSFLDNLIALNQRKYDQLKQIKQSMLLNMFPQNDETKPKLRFAGFTDDWEQRKLGELASFTKGKGYSKSDIKENGMPIILYGRLYTKYETVISDVDTFADEKDGSVLSLGGEVIIPASGETAEDISVASVVDKSGVLIGGDLNIVTPPEDIDPAFLAISITYGNAHKKMTKLAQGKTVVHLHNDDLKKIDLAYPSYQEQTRISSCFNQIDNLITLHQRKLDNLKTIKTAFLQRMFA